MFCPHYVSHLLKMSGFHLFLSWSVDLLKKIQNCSLDAEGELLTLIISIYFRRFLIKRENKSNLPPCFSFSYLWTSIVDDACMR